jgi:hypothetical protein
LAGEWDLPSVPPYKTRSREEMNTRDYTLIALIAALYTALTIVFTIISYGPIQLRIADCLIALSAVFGLPAVIGVGLGAFLGNAYFGLGAIDIVFGAIANLAGGYIIFKMKKKLLLGLLAGSLVVGIMVGGYLWIYFPPPDIMGLNLPVWLGMIISITLSSIIAIVGLGYSLVQALETSGILENLK